MRSSSFRDIIFRLRRELTELIFPRCGTCSSCGRVLMCEEYICVKCEAELLRAEHFCSKCNRITDSNGICLRCSIGDTCWDDCSGSFVYDYPADTLIHDMKYKNHPDAATYLGEFLTEDILKKYSREDFDIITFVPSSEAHLLERGYNQAQLLARHVGNSLGTPVEDLLVAKDGIRQVGLSGSDRLKNARDKFSVKDDINVMGKRIIIIDDVITTGSTMNACSKLLKDSGASYILAVSVAQTASAVGV